jgi:antitoxin component YwqK of YwqJK toxin-antitoxin module
MKSLHTLLLLLVSLSAFSADTLPLCAGEDSTKWHNCMSDLSPYSGPGRGPYKSGKRHGDWSGGPTGAGEQWSVTYVNGEIEGTLRAFAQASESTSNYKDGKLHGEKITYWRDDQGVVQSLGSFENGVRVGMHYFNALGSYLDAEGSVSIYDAQGVELEDGNFTLKNGKISLLERSQTKGEQIPIEVYQNFIDDVNKTYREATGHENKELHYQ